MISGTTLSVLRAAVNANGNDVMRDAKMDILMATKKTHYGMTLTNTFHATSAEVEAVLFGASIMNVTNMKSDAYLDGQPVPKV
jgi:hypothetical protein